MAADRTPVIAGWWSEDPTPRLLASRCRDCGDLVFPPVPQGAAAWCRNPMCDGEDRDVVMLSPRGTVWSYTDAQYQPPSPYVAATSPYQPFALAAVELPEGLVVLGQVADGYGVEHLAVGASVELVVEPLNADDTGIRTTYRWKPVADGAT